MLGADVFNLLITLLWEEANEFESSFSVDIRSIIVSFALSMKEDTAKKIIDDVRRKYDNVSKRFSDSRVETWTELEPLFDNYLRKGASVLDLGCGNGRFSVKVDPSNYIGVDFSEELIKIARKNHPQATFLVADALNLPFDNNRFNLVYAIGLLHHIPSRRLRDRIIKETYRVLVPNGVAIFTVWDIWEKTARRKMVVKEAIKSFFGLSDLEKGDLFLNWQGEDDFYFHSFSLSGLIREFEQNDFELVDSGKLPSQKGGTNIFVVMRKDS